MTSVRTDDLDYDLPGDAIAEVPAEPRDSARLLDATGPDVAHRHVRDLAGLVGPGDLLVLNETRVLPARVRFTRPTGGAAEVLLLEPTEPPGWWSALVRPSAKLRPGTRVAVDAELSFEFGDDLGDGQRMVRPIAQGSLIDALARCGEMPLPPYLGRTRLDDPDRYQTVYAADRAQSAAAPTAGLHLTPELLDEVAAAGAQVARVELVVGLGTFRPMTAERVEDHRMHRERYVVPPATWEAVQRTQRDGGRVVAVGTTSVRALESAAATGELEGSTDLFIRSPYGWRVVDLLLTNFHLPRSTLLVMVEAFAGPRWRALYCEALAEGYRFLSFGDAMLLARAATPVGGLA